MAVEPIFESLMASRSSLLVRIRDLCRPEIVQPVIELIHGTINDDVTFTKTPLDRRNQRTYAVRVSRSTSHDAPTAVSCSDYPKTGVFDLLDVARQTYKEGTDDIYQLVDEINSKWLSNLVLSVRKITDYENSLLTRKPRD